MQYKSKIGIYLHDAVYLYLRTVNHTLAEGNSNFSDGRLIFRNSIGQRFVGTRDDSIVSNDLIDRCGCILFSSNHIHGRCAVAHLANCCTFFVF